MIITGIILLIIGVILINLLNPKEDVSAIQIVIWPKVISIIATILGAILILIGLVK